MISPILSIAGKLILAAAHQGLREPDRTMPCTAGRLATVLAIDNQPSRPAEPCRSVYKRTSVQHLISIAVVLIASVGYANLATSDDSANSKTHDDNVVLEMVLADLTTYDRPNLPLSIGNRIPRNVYFSRSAINSTPDASEPLTRNEVWATMTDVEQRTVRDAITDISNRHGSDSFARDFAAKNPAIRIVDKPTERSNVGSKVPYGARFPIQAWPPGYSGDNMYVVVHLYFPEIFHPSYATYVLISEHGKWIIKFRGFVTYL